MRQKPNHGDGDRWCIRILLKRNNTFIRNRYSYSSFASIVVCLLDPLTSYSPKAFVFTRISSLQLAPGGSSWRCDRGQNRQQKRLISVCVVYIINQSPATARRT